MEWAWKPPNILLHCAVVMGVSLRHDRIALFWQRRDMNSIVALNTQRGGAVRKSPGRVKRVAYLYFISVRDPRKLRG